MAGVQDGVRRSTLEDWQAEPSRRERITFVGTMGVAYCLGAVKTLVFAKILGAEELAYYGLVLLVVQLGGNFSQWGVMSGLNVELPLAYGRGEQPTDVLVERGLGAVICASLTTAAVYLAVVYAIGPESSAVRLSLSLAAATTVFALLTEFAILLLRAQRRLAALGALYVTKNGLVIAIGAGAAIVWGYGGAIVGEIAALLLVVWLAKLAWRVDMKPRWPDWDVTRFLLRAGAPLLVSVSLLMAAFMVDRLFVAVVLPDQFGQYTFASVVSIAAITVQATINQVVPPQLLYERGAGLSLSALLRRLHRFVAKVIAIGAAGFVVLIVGIELTKDGLFSEYSAGLDVMPILYLGAVLALLVIYEVQLIAARRFGLIVLMASSGLLVGLVGSVAVTLIGPSLTSYAWVFVASRVATSLGLVVGAHRITRSHPDQRARGLPHEGRGGF